jgi:uncharacterized protein YbjT (DUF2867 family)
MTVLLAGATGLVGENLLHILLREPQVSKVIALTRRPLSISHPKLDVRVTDMEHLERLSLEKVDVGVSCLGSTKKKAGSKAAFYKVDHDMILSLAKLAQKSGAHRFSVISAAGANPDSAIFYNRVKGETERDLGLLGFEALSIFRPSLLLGERHEKRWAEGLAIRLYPLYRPLLAGPMAKTLGKMRPIESTQVARAMLMDLLAEKKDLAVIENDEIHRMTE